ncbi:MAG: DivIVA domain-containing protein [Eubacteriales bacterium]|nr:DivIVA domain-containing protein [Eubacteriales bacterium]
MENLKKSIMGKYNATDVDMLLLKVRSDYEKCLKEQKERIIKLREENKEMSMMIERYKSNEKYIIGAITKAEETAQSIVNDAERKAKERLKMAENEQKQIMMAAQGCYLRLCRLRQVSETIFRAVSTVMGGFDETEKSEMTGNVRPIRNMYDGAK